MNNFINLSNPYDSKIMAPFYTRPTSLYLDIISKIRSEIFSASSDLAAPKKFQKALDIGCGTGISTVPLTEIANEVIGIDPSINMLNQADQTNKKVSYQVASAENLPFEDKIFDLVIFSVSFHFTNQKKALAEAARVLIDNGTLIIYYTAFTGIESEEYQNWINNTLRAKYPYYYQANREFTTQDLKTSAFPNISEIKYQDDMIVDKNDLSHILMTLASVFDKAESQKEDPKQIKNWMMESLAPLFCMQKTLKFRWDVSIWNMKRKPRTEENEILSIINSP